MVDCTSSDTLAAYTFQLAELDRFFAQECYRTTLGFFPTVRVWICPSCDSTIPDKGLPSPIDMSHTSDCAWIEALHEWPPDIVDFYIATWMQRQPMSKRLIRGLCTPVATAKP